MKRYTRRHFLQATAATPALVAAPWLWAGSSPVFDLVANRRKVSLVGRGYPDTEVWGYNGQVPGPVIRAPRGAPLSVRVSNQLDQPTTVHWHGLRIANDMDGVPGLTQRPIEPGERFRYQFTPPDAGTFWYHAHVNSSEQVGRGLYGALIIDEDDPPAVDRDEIWVLDDWLLNRGAQIVDAFDRPHDAAHAGQIGNTVTVNGRITDEFGVSSNERIRLRLINAANGRIFRLRFEQHDPMVIALDGQPVLPHRPAERTLTLGPAMRADLILDCAGEPGQRTPVIDLAYREPYRLLDLVYGASAPVRREPIHEPAALSDNPVPEPDLAAAERLEVEFGGGMHGQLSGALYNGRWLDVRTLFQQGKMWAMNGLVGSADPAVPLFELKANRTYMLHLVNNSRWPHPIHLHGHHFRVLNRNGNPVPGHPWQDTVLLGADERVDIAFVADNRGEWLFHCHIPEHMAAGMTAVVRVA